MTDSKPFSVTPYLDIVYRHRRGAAGVFAVGCTVTLCLALLLRNVYVASAVILIEAPRIAPGYVSMSADRTENVRLSDQLEALARKAFTEAWLADLILRFDLYHLAPGRSSKQPSHSLEPMARYMRTNIALTVPEDTIRWEGARPRADSPVVLTISFEYSDPHIAQKVAAELAKRFIEAGQKEEVDRAVDATRFLQSQLTQARLRLDQKAEQKRQLEQRFQGSLPEELPANLAQLDRLEEQLRLVEERMAVNPLAPLGAQSALTPEQQLASLQLKMTHLRAEYSDQYPDVIDLKAEIADLKAQIAAEPETSTKKHPPDFVGGAPDRRGLEQQAAVITQKMQSLQQNIAVTPEHGQELAAVNRDYEAMSAEYHQLLDKEMTAELRQNLEKRKQDEQLRLLNPVSLPKMPKRPNRIAICLVGVSLSLVASLALPFGLFFTDTSFKDPEELETAYGITVAAAIPVVDAEGEQRRATIQALMLSSASVLLVAGSAFAYVKWFRG